MSLRIEMWGSSGRKSVFRANNTFGAAVGSETIASLCNKMHQFAWTGGEKHGCQSKGITAMAKSLKLATWTSSKVNCGHLYDQMKL